MSATRYHAHWVLPVSAPPIRDGTVVVDGGRIAWVGARADAPPGEDRELGRAVLLPGLVNAHTHLELTAFRSLLDGLPFREWIIRLQGAKTAVMSRERFLDSARLGIVEGLGAGITTYADTCDSGVALEAMREAGVRGIMYQEVFSPSADPARVREAAEGLRAKLAALEPLESELHALGISPHAPYTVCDPLFALAARSGRPLAVHVAESEAETRFVCDGTGPFADGLRARGIDVTPRGRSPVALLDRLGILDARALLIHCVRVDDEDIRAIARAGAPVAHCPVSNAKLGHGAAPILEMLEAGVVVGLGSDSMASNDRMHLLEEARVAVLAQRGRARRPDALPAARAIELATLGGARALGLDARVGSIEAGKDADLAAFPLPEGVAADADPAGAAVFALGGARASMVAVAGTLLVWDGRLVRCDHALPGRVADTADRLGRHLATSA
ncbi:MAG TPA: amidohydrolase family protein [Gemmatimonadaceae bacterium]|nr:amidohydrolase family protein [Gemmatimonadaceae bacterium]